MTTADQALSREIERGMTRQDILRRAAALGIVVGGSLGPLTEAAFAESPLLRQGRLSVVPLTAAQVRFIEKAGR